MNTDIKNKEVKTFNAFIDYYTIDNNDVLKKGKKVGVLNNGSKYKFDHENGNTYYLDHYTNGYYTIGGLA